MKWAITIVVAAVLGTAAAWAMVDSKYGQREMYFGVIDANGEVTAEDIPSVVNLDDSSAYAKIALPDGHEHDFGVMRPDQKGEHVFRIRNEGSIPLTLTIGAATCKCTLGSLENEKLMPDEETTVKMEWSIETDADEFEQSAELRTNDPERPAVQFKITGRVVRGVELVPRALTFGEAAAGDPIELTAKIYNYQDEDIDIRDVRFSGDFLTENAEVDIEPFTPSAEDGIHADAREGYRVNIEIPPGLPQGSMQTNIGFGFVKLDEDGNVIPVDPDDPEKMTYLPASLAGRVVGVLSMITSSKLKELDGGTYVYDIGRLRPEDDFEAKALVVVKGSQRDNTNLSVGEVHPEGVLEARLEEPLMRGQMALHRLVIRFKPGPEPVERLGKNKQDYGWVLIESDNAKVPPMRVVLKFALPAI